jgi:hypothetical protein
MGIIHLFDGGQLHFLVIFQGYVVLVPSGKTPSGEVTSYTQELEMSPAVTIVLPDTLDNNALQESPPPTTSSLLGFERAILHLGQTRFF